MWAADETRASPAFSSPAWPRRLRAGSGSAPWTPGRPHSLGGSSGQGAGPPRSPALLGRSSQNGCYLWPCLASPRPGSCGPPGGARRAP